MNADFARAALSAYLALSIYFAYSKGEISHSVKNSRATLVYSLFHENEFISIPCTAEPEAPRLLVRVRVLVGGYRQTLNLVSFSRFRSNLEKRICSAQRGVSMSMYLRKQNDFARKRVGSAGHGE